MWHLILEVLGQERRGAVPEGAPPISRTQSGLARELERVRSFPLLLDQNLEPTVAHAEVSEPSRNPLERHRGKNSLFPLGFSLPGARQACWKVLTMLPAHPPDRWSGEGTEDSSFAEVLEKHCEQSREAPRWPFPEGWMESHGRCRGRTMLLGQRRSWNLRAAGNTLLPQAMYVRSPQLSGQCDELGAPTHGGSGDSSLPSAPRRRSGEQKLHLSYSAACSPSLNF